MNLYKLYSTPESLNFYETVSDNNPDIFWEKYKDSKEELKRREKYIAKSPKYSYYYAETVLKGPFPLGEEAIAKDVDHAYLYAKYILKGPFPKGEEAIAKDAYSSLYYAVDILKGPFPAGEASISKDVKFAYYYAKNVLKKDFYLNGKLIVKYKP